MKKIILGGLLTGLAMLIAGMIAGQLVNLLMPSLQTQYANPCLFRPWADWHMNLYFLHPFAVGLALAWIWLTPSSW